MGIARDIFEILDENIDNFTDQFLKKLDDHDTQAGSIARRAADGTLFFPVLVSRALEYNIAQKATKACEINAASFAQIVLTMNPEMDMTSGKNAVDYIRKFHTNADTHEDIFGSAMHVISTKTANEALLIPIYVDSDAYKICKEELTEFGVDWREGRLNDVVHPVHVHEQKMIVKNKADVRRIMLENLQAVKEARGRVYHTGQLGNSGNKHYFVVPDGMDVYDSDGNKYSGTRIHGVNDVDSYINQLGDEFYEIDPSELGFTFSPKRAAGRDVHNESSSPEPQGNAGGDSENSIPPDGTDSANDAGDEPINDNSTTASHSNHSSSSNNHGHGGTRGPKGDRGDRGERGPQGNAGKEGPPGRRGRDGRDAVVTINNIKGDRHTGPTEGFKLPDRVLKDQEVKKANELAPIILHIRVIGTKEKGGAGQYIDFLVGVKATMHPINSDEMVTELVKACRYHDEIFRFIRWTTGEISFFGDFLLNMKDSRKSIERQSAGGSPWFNRLRRMSVIGGFKKRMFMKHRVLPNASIAVSQQEVDFIRTNYGFDLMKPQFVEEIMQKFFLLCFIIVDDALEVVHFKYDSHKSYQTISFSGLERENSNAARQFRDILKAVQRV